MPELRSGARRSKRLGDLQPAPQPVGQEENLVLPTQNRTRRRGGGGRGRGNATGIGKGPSGTTRGRPSGAGRGRGIRLIDLDPEPPCEVLPQAAPVGVAEPAFNRVDGADKKIAMDGGGSADKVMGVEEETGTTPVPDRVSSCLLLIFFTFGFLNVYG